MNTNFQTFLLIVILFVLIVIEYRVTGIHLKLTERQRLKERKERAEMKAFLRDIDLKKREFRLSSGYKDLRG